MLILAALLTVTACVNDSQGAAASATHEILSAEPTDTPAISLAEPAQTEQPSAPSAALDAAYADTWFDFSKVEPVLNDAGDVQAYDIKKVCRKR